MQWLLNLATRVKLLLGFGLMILFLAAVVAAAYRSIGAIQESQERLYREDFAYALDLMSLRMNQNGVRAALLTMLSVNKRSDQETSHQDVKERAEENDEIMRRLRERGRDDPVFLRRFEELQRARVAYKETRNMEIIPLIYEGKAEEAKKVALVAASSQQQLVGMDRVASAMENIKQATTQNVASTKQAEVAAKGLHDLGQNLRALEERYRV